MLKGQKGEPNVFEIANKYRVGGWNIWHFHALGKLLNGDKRLGAEFGAHQTSWQFSKIKRNSAIMHSYK